MTQTSLETASQYLNNLLLSRGLLQDGKTINFAEPAAESHETDATMSRIINLVHDLVLRRDRDAEQREFLSSSIRNLRAEESQRVLDLQKLQDKNVELARIATSAEAQERLLKNLARKAEAQVKELREQMLKLKSNLDQVRAKCISDVRKRDIELEKLKTHLAGSQRGRKELSGVKINTMNPQALAGSRQKTDAQDISSGEWTLEKETNEFLAALVNETSTENVELRKIVQGTMDTLSQLTGLELSTEEVKERDSGIGIPGQYRTDRLKGPDNPQDTITSCQTLANQMDSVLQHCKSILKDPSFVPIEEVQVREEEIVKLRIGWEKMANRWKEAVTMMDTWKRRVLDSDEAADVTDLADLSFGRSIAVLPNGEPVLGNEPDLSSILFDQQKVDADGDARNVSMIEDESTKEEELHPEEESEIDFPLPEPKRLAASPARRGVQLPRPIRVLSSIRDNVVQTSSARKSDLSAIDSTDSALGSLDGTIEGGDDDETTDIWVQEHSRIPKKESALSIAQKLVAVEQEAREAEFSRQRRDKRKIPSNPSRSGRRRSTLNPQELASLMRVR